MFHGFIFTPLDEFVDGVVIEAGGIVTLCVHADGYIGDGQVLIVFVLTVHIDDLTEDADGMSQVIAGFGSPLNGDTNDDVGTHLTGDVGRVVVA